MTHFRLLAVALTWLVLAQSAQAADARGAYAIKGPGKATCEQFTYELQQKSDTARQLMIWMTGYLTAYNHLESGTVDVVPWQSVDLLAQYLKVHCQKNPQMLFANSVDAMTRALAPYRLTESSPTINIEVAGHRMEIYQEILRRVQQALRDKGLYLGAVDGTLSASFTEAVQNFQKEIGAPTTGELDQVTLLKILQP